MIANRIWLIEYQASDGEWYPTLPREYFEFKKEALKVLRWKYEPRGYRVSWCFIRGAKP